MDPITHIPKDRPSIRPLRVVVLLGMTILLFLLILEQSGQAADMLLATGAR